MSGILPKDFIRVPISEAISIPEKGGFYRLIKNHYWQVDNSENILFYKNLYSPQCNMNKAIVESIAGKIEEGMKAVLIENVWIKHNCEDYQ